MVKLNTKIGGSAHLLKHDCFAFGEALVITFLDLTIKALVICKDNGLIDPFISDQMQYVFKQMLTSLYSMWKQK